MGVVLEGENIAYKYTTKNRKIVVNEVPTSDVRPECDLSDHIDSAMVQS
jgi:hypothetical protein